ncbi:hypothetical protein OWR28_22650 [Chryseobacterium sp. 1B4]
MKSILLKTQKIIFVLFGFTLVLAQSSMKIPSDAVFYMEVNGKQLNNKINWNKLNPLLHELSKKAKKIFHGQITPKQESNTMLFSITMQALMILLRRIIPTLSSIIRKSSEFINSVKKKGRKFPAEKTILM